MKVILIFIALLLYTSAQGSSRECLEREKSLYFCGKEYYDKSNKEIKNFCREEILDFIYGLKTGCVDVRYGLSYPGRNTISQEDQQDLISSIIKSGKNDILQKINDLEKESRLKEDAELDFEALELDF